MYALAVVLPNFLVIGAAKAGTTALYHYLRQHPDVFMPEVKEVRYSRYEGVTDADVQVHTRAAYERLFASAGTAKAIGEASPQYLNSEVGPDRIAEDLPDVKLIVLLRDPVARAYSSYLGRQRGGSERRSVDEAMRPGTYYVETSRYFPRLSRYIHRFGRDRVKVILHDDLSTKTHEVVGDLFGFIGVDHSFVPDVSRRHNEARVPRFPRANAWLMRAGTAMRRTLGIRRTGLLAAAQRPLLGGSPPKLPEPIAARLRDEFREDLARTSELIGRDLGHWLQ